jgi:RHS repeat-associated protein
MPVTTYTSFMGRVVREDRGGTVRDYGRDTLGSTAALYDESGNKTDEFHYWPYGEVRSHTGSSATPLTYVGTLGYYMDSARRYYVRARSYRADLGRWTTVDPLWPRCGLVKDPGEPGWQRCRFHLGQSKSVDAYLYCNNAPCLQTDNSGLRPQCTWPWEKPNPWEWGYGNSCGGSRQGQNGVAIDCLDSCCESHDYCLRDWWMFLIPLRRRWCDCHLAICAMSCGASGCEDSPDPQLCRIWSNSIGIVYLISCTQGATGLW